MLKQLFFLLIVRPVILLGLGLNVRRHQNLPKKGPAILIANHNSHLDTMVLMCLFPMKMLGLLRPVAAQDYFFRNRFLKYFSDHVIGAIPIARKREGNEDPLRGVQEALDKGHLVILFPEGTRGEPEVMGELKGGVARLAERNPQIPVVPIFLHGLGKSLPRNEALFVPFFCDVFIGKARVWSGDKDGFLKTLQTDLTQLKEEAYIPEWS